MSDADGIDSDNITSKESSTAIESNNSSVAVPVPSEVEVHDVTAATNGIDCDMSTAALRTNADCGTKFQNEANEEFSLTPVSDSSVNIPDDISETSTIEDGYDINAFIETLGNDTDIQEDFSIRSAYDLDNTGSYQYNFLFPGEFVENQDELCPADAKWHTKRRSMQADLVDSRGNRCAKQTHLTPEMGYTRARSKSEECMSQPETGLLSIPLVTWSGVRRESTQSEGGESTKSEPPSSDRVIGDDVTSGLKGMFYRRTTAPNVSIPKSNVGMLRAQFEKVNLPQMMINGVRDADIDEQRTPIFV